MCAGACAPSTMVIKPFSFAMAQISSAGKINPVALVICEINIAFVFSLQPLKKSSTNFSLVVIGRLIFCLLYVAPFFFCAGGRAHCALKGIEPAERGTLRPERSEGPGSRAASGGTYEQSELVTAGSIPKIT